MEKKPEICAVLKLKLCQRHPTKPKFETDRFRMVFQAAIFYLAVPSLPVLPAHDKKMTKQF